MTKSKIYLLLLILFSVSLPGTGIAQTAEQYIEKGDALAEAGPATTTVGIATSAANSTRALISPSSLFGCLSYTPRGSPVPFSVPYRPRAYQALTAILNRSWSR